MIFTQSMSTYVQLDKYAYMYVCMRLLTLSHDANHGVDVVGVLQHGAQVRFQAGHVVEHRGQGIHHIVALIAARH